MYKTIKDHITKEVRTDVILKNDLHWVPNDPANRDWQEYQEWLAQGNQPDAMLEVEEE